MGVTVSVVRAAGGPRGALWRRERCGQKLGQQRGLGDAPCIYQAAHGRRAHGRAAPTSVPTKPEGPRGCCASLRPLQQARCSGTLALPAQAGTVPQLGLRHPERRQAAETVGILLAPRYPLLPGSQEEHVVRTAGQRRRESPL